MGPARRLLLCEESVLVLVLVLLLVLQESVLVLVLLMMCEESIQSATHGCDRQWCFPQVKNAAWCEVPLTRATLFKLARQCQWAWVPLAA